MKFGDHVVYFAGATTTVKLYHDGLEFAAHDQGRLRRVFRQVRTQQYPDEDSRGIGYG